jgi:hypothetical protein
MGCSSRPCASAKPLAGRYITHSKFKRALYLAWSNSTSLSFGVGTGSNIFFIRSTDGGNTWSAPVQVNPSGADDKHHVLPALAIDNDPNDVHITYYTQHSDDTIDLDMTNSHDGAAIVFPATERLT